MTDLSDKTRSTEDVLATRRHILEFIRKHIAEHGYAPTFNEIGATVYRSRPALRRHLKEMARLGLINYEEGNSRALTINETNG